MVTIQDQVARAAKTLIFEEPYYGLFLVSLNKVYRKDIPTAGVSKNGLATQLAINPEFFLDLTEEQRIGLLKHELLHISFGHLLTREVYNNHKLFNIAADLEINQYISDSYLPPGGLTLDMFQELNLDKKAGTKYYYEMLEQAQEDGTCPNLDNLLDKMDGSSQYDHMTWDEFEELPEAEKKLVQKQIEHQLKETAEQTEKRRGTIPGELAELIKRLLHVDPPKFDWKGYLRRFVGNSTITYTKKLRRKYNKRYSENPGLKIKFKNHILVGVDTSGSVNSDELKEFFSELTHMHKTGHKITVAQCDTRLNSVDELSFQPVIDHYNDKGHYTALVYLTDGEASSPEDCPKNTLWVLSSVSNMNDELPGQVIKLN